LRRTVPKGEGQDWPVLGEKAVMEKLGKKTLARCWCTAGVYDTGFTEKVAEFLNDLFLDIRLLRSFKTLK
jgi:hypothetical protein